MSDTRFFTFYSLTGGAGATTLAISVAKKLFSEGKKVEVIVEDKSKFEDLKLINYPFSIKMLSKDLDFLPDIQVVIFILQGDVFYGKLKKTAVLTGGKNIVVVEPTEKGARALTQLRERSANNDQCCVVFNKVLSGRKTHQNILAQHPHFSIVKNRMLYESVLSEKTSLFENNEEQKDFIREEIEKLS